MEPSELPPSLVDPPSMTSDVRHDRESIPSVIEWPVEVLPIPHADHPPTALVGQGTYGHARRRRAWIRPIRRFGLAVIVLLLAAVVAARFAGPLESAVSSLASRLHGHQAPVHTALPVKPVTVSHQPSSPQHPATPVSAPRGSGSPALPSGVTRTAQVVCTGGTPGASSCGWQVTGERGRTLTLIITPVSSSPYTVSVETPQGGRLGTFAAPGSRIMTVTVPSSPGVLVVVVTPQAPQGAAFSIRASQ